MEDRCVCCGEIIPEGRMICWACERGATPPVYTDALLEDSTAKQTR